MQVVYERCCGLDVHKKSIAACLIVPDSKGQPTKQVRHFGTLTAQLLDLADWLIAHQVTHVAMESTGVYWKPVYNVLEGTCTVLLVNAQHVKALPGRKTDLKDCEWLADLLRHGLVRGSFVPEAAQRELRDLTRYRVALLQERTAETNRLHKTLEGANIKLSSVVTDIRGVSARAMLAALVEGESDPAVLAQLAKKRLRAKLPVLEQALHGRFSAHHRFLVSLHLARLDELDAAIDQLSHEISARLGGRGEPATPPDDPGASASADARRSAVPTTDAPAVAEIGEAPPGAATGGGAPGAGGRSGAAYADTITRLQTIPGVGPRTAEVLVAEIGIDMTRFPSARHLASWAGMCPGNHESAGKRLSGTTRHGSPWLRSALVEAAHAAGRTKDTYLAAQYRRVLTRRGKKRAAVAVGHSILVIAYHLLSRQTTYLDLGANYFDERERDALQRRLIRRLESLDLEVTVRPKSAA
jgi:transposase